MEERKVAGIIVDEKTAAEHTKAAMNELMGVDGDSHNMNFHTIMVERDGQLVEIEVPIDDIDLLDEFDDEDLTEEGERSLGIIDSEYDSMSNDKIDRKSRDRVAIVNLVVENEEDEINIVCPYTGSSNVYQIDSSTWASFETDQPFIVRIKTKDEED